jgi:hypothetical protein
MVERQQIMDAILGLAERPEWCERSMDPERAKVDLVLLAARGDAVTVAGMARRWGMPRTSARRVMQTAAKLVPWLDSPKNDHVTDHEAACLDTMVDMDADTMPDSQSRDAAAAPAMLADTVADIGADSLMDSQQNMQSGDHEDEELVMKLDTMTEQWPGEVAFLSDVQESESMDSMVDMDTDSQNQDMAEVPAMLADTISDMGADSETTGVREAFLDITDLDEPGEIDGMAALESLLDALPAETQRQAPVIGMGLRRPPVAISLAPAPAADDESQVEVRAREMAAEAWDCADARTFQTCEGEFEQFWMCRKRHFLELAGQELAGS